jgi:hypothetical protein
MDKRNNIQLMLFQGQFNRSCVHLKARERRERKKTEYTPLYIHMYNMNMIDSSNSKKKRDRNIYSTSNGNV